MYRIKPPADVAGATEHNREATQWRGDYLNWQEAGFDLARRAETLNRRVVELLQQSNASAALILRAESKVQNYGR